MKATPEHAPWWIVGGDQQCAFCLQRYAWPMEVRCRDCDRPACPWCATRPAGRTDRVCPDCVNGAAA